jgi:hypothetical protein
MVRKGLPTVIALAVMPGCASRLSPGGAQPGAVRCVEQAASSAGFHLRRRQPGLLVFQTVSDNPVEALYVTVARDSTGRDRVVMVAGATYDRIYGQHGSVAAPRDSRLAVRGGTYLERRDSTSAETRRATDLVRSACRMGGAAR